MVQLRRDLDLLQKPLRAECCGEVGAENFECDITVELQVFGEVNRRHTTRADLPLYGVAVLQSLLQTAQNIIVGHGRYPRFPKRHGQNTGVGGVWLGCGRGTGRVRSG